MTNKHQEDLEHIRSMMERSSRFISLSGISGVIAGIVALVASGFAYYFMYVSNTSYFNETKFYDRNLLIKLLIVGISALVCAIFAGIFFTVRKSRKNNIKIWTATSRRLIINLAIPLFAGGIFCIAMINYGIAGLVAPVTLIFYGLALINAGKYTLNDVEYLGYFELALGLISLFFTGYGLYFWAIGFGLLHIIYGILMEKKYH